jgi:DNA (cytosine-5)-methyltransferase 1
MKKYKTLDLFAGIGGIRLGFETAGFETVFANDFDAYCGAIHFMNNLKFKLCKRK